MSEIYAVVVEGAMEAPILMESEGKMTSRESAEDRLSSLLSGNWRWIRGCVVRIEYVSGNESVLKQMEAMQK